jgi:hypothetical protein
LACIKAKKKEDLTNNFIDVQKSMFYPKKKKKKKKNYTRAGRFWPFTV